MDESLDPYVVLPSLIRLLLMDCSYHNFPSAYGRLNPVLPHQDLVFLEGCGEHC
jgi:hypothetical protein